MGSLSWCSWSVSCIAQEVKSSTLGLWLMVLNCYWKGWLCKYRFMALCFQKIRRLAVECWIILSRVWLSRRHSWAINPVLCSYSPPILWSQSYVISFPTLPLLVHHGDSWKCFFGLNSSPLWAIRHCKSLLTMIFLWYSYKSLTISHYKSRSWHWWRLNSLDLDPEVPCVRRSKAHWDHPFIWVWRDKTRALIPGHIRANFMHV